MTEATPVRQHLSQRLRASKKFREFYFRTRTRNKIAAELRQLRELRGLKQADLLEKFGIHQSAISRIEKAEYSSWTYKTLSKSTEALDGILDVSIRPVERYIEECEREELAEEAEIKKSEQMNARLQDKNVQQAIAAASHPPKPKDRRVVDFEQYRISIGQRPSPKHGLSRQVLNGSETSTQTVPSEDESQTLVEAMGGR